MVENKIREFDYMEKQAITNLHWSLEDYENTDFYRLCEVLKADGKQLEDPVANIRSNLRTLK